MWRYPPNNDNRVPLGIHLADVGTKSPQWTLMGTTRNNPYPFSPKGANKGLIWVFEVSSAHRGTMWVRCGLSKKI